MILRKETNKTSYAIRELTYMVHFEHSQVQKKIPRIRMDTKQSQNKMMLVIMTKTLQLGKKRQPKQNVPPFAESTSLKCGICHQKGPTVYKNTHKEGLDSFVEELYFWLTINHNGWEMVFNSGLSWSVD